MSAQCALPPVHYPPNLFSKKLARLHLSKLSAAEYVNLEIFREKRCDKEVVARWGVGEGVGWGKGWGGGGN